ncbi:MAG: hypothetical protein H0X16_08895 [Chloroflexi bacterium]|nr:hypothetical protein [Chloroflexota bacterium]
MNTEWQIWLLILVAAVVGGVIWLVYGRLPLDEDDLTDEGRATEAQWINQALTSTGTDVPVSTVSQVLDLHRRYLELPPEDASEADVGVGRTQITSTEVVGAQPAGEPDHAGSRAIDASPEPPVRPRTRHKSASADARQAG